MEDLEGWEVLPDDGFLEIHDDDGHKVFSRKFGIGSNNVFKNYFICPSPKSPQFVDSTEHSRLPKQLVTVPIQLEPADDHKLSDQEFLKQLTGGHPVQINISPSVMPEQIGPPNVTGGAMEADQDPVSQVSFKKMKEPEFVEMKMDSPRSNGRGIKPQIDAGGFQFDDEGDVLMGEPLETKISSPKFRPSEEQKMKTEVEKEATWKENSGGPNLWKWSLTGIGAICSFGVAAATVCIIILGGRQKNRQDNQKLQFHIYAEDKRLKQMVHHATKLNEAISAVRGVPMTRAHISFGGYYDGL